jgi:methionyl-tRNA synthetase
MPQRILVAVAWPYANGALHLGHLAGVTCLPIYSPGIIASREMTC